MGGGWWARGATNIHKLGQPDLTNCEAANFFDHSPEAEATPSPSPLSSSATCARYSSRSLIPHSEASLPGSLSATGGPAVRPTSVVARKSRIALLHLLSAKSSEILNRSLPRPVSSLTTAQSTGCATAPPNTANHWASDNLYQTSFNCKIAELLAVEQCSQAVIVFLATADVWRTSGPPVAGEGDRRPTRDFLSSLSLFFFCHTTCGDRQA